MSPPLRTDSSPDTTKSISIPGLRLGAAALIFLISLLASSFPSLAKRAPRIEPPLVVFFIGKHFGTGVILSTAFVHLLPESFESLSNPSLPPIWKKWTGLIVLLSFLSIFLIEYVSSVYVEHISDASSHAAHSRPITDHAHVLDIPYRDEPDADPSPLEDSQASLDANGRPMARRPSSSLRWHHRHESPRAHTHKAGPRLSNRQSLVSVLLAGHEGEGNGRAGYEDGPGEGHGHGVGVLQGEVSRKTRVISILVLQLGIMIHSAVIGLTLAITAGSDFTSLLVAVIFHQLFEGLSLGIRISTLPGPNGRTLPAILCTLFAAAAPAGVLLGLWLLPPTTAGAGLGLMCALSAGMLIYAGAVEMLAGDFVMDVEMRRGGMGQQVLALLSLCVGVCAMGALGM